MTINEKILKEFERYLIEEEKSKATIGKYVHDVAELINYLGKGEVTKIKLLEYKDKILSEYKPASVNSMIASINKFFEFCSHCEFKLKSLKIQKKIFINKEKELTKEEYKRLLAIAQRRGNKRLYYLMQTICSTGIRVSEVKFITAEAVAVGAVQINCKGKMRVVLLPDELCKMLKGYIKKQEIKKGPVFVTKNGKPLDRSNIWSDMKALCKEAGVDSKKVFPHNLRHLFARVYYAIEKDIVRLADILGHSSVNTTRIYTIETGEVHRKQIERLGLLRC